MRRGAVSRGTKRSGSSLGPLRGGGADSVSTVAVVAEKKEEAEEEAAEEEEGRSRRRKPWGIQTGAPSSEP